MVVPSTLFLYCSVQRIGDNWFISPAQSHKKQLAKFTELLVWWDMRAAVSPLYWPFEKHPTPTSRYHNAALCFLPQSSEFLVRPVTSLWIHQRFCVPYIWQLISNELFSAHKKSSYRTKSGCFIHTGWMIVGLMLCDPPPLFIIPKCFTQMLPPFASAIPQTKAASFRNKRITDKV